MRSANFRLGDHLDIDELGAFVADDTDRMVDDALGDMPEIDLLIDPLSLKAKSFMKIMMPTAPLSRSVTKLATTIPHLAILANASGLRGLSHSSWSELYHSGFATSDPRRSGCSRPWT
jgi:hypothetical protein